MKTEYLAKIKKLLSEYEISKTEIDDIVSDYDGMYEDGLAKGMNEEEVQNFLGNPEVIVQDLAEGYERKERLRSGRKLVALSPFISIIIFFILGFGFEKWNPGWMVFLMTPISAVVVEFVARRSKGSLIAMTPFIALIIFLALGFSLGIWHPTWLIFLAIPIVSIVVSAKNKGLWETLTALSPLVALIIFIICGYFGYWHPTWLVFFIVPILGIMNHKDVKKRIIYEVTLLLTIGLYLLVGYISGRWGLGLVVFLLPFAVSLLMNDVKLEVEGKFAWLELSLAILFVIIYIGFGIWLKTWGFLWMIFLLIPMVSIIRKVKGSRKIVALMPFLSLIVFFSLGYFLGAWHVAWMAFLSIPVTGILVGKEKNHK
ncbi:MAG: hypothetical protein PHS68_07105 [Candidatus Izemoplasmatales bacterium]|nr:hypothetical protein [Candidatus Izemoplasmatales bacterium]